MMTLLLVWELQPFKKQPRSPFRKGWIKGRLSLFSAEAKLPLGLCLCSREDRDVES